MEKSTKIQSLLDKLHRAYSTWYGDTFFGCACKPCVGKTKEIKAIQKEIREAANGPDPCCEECGGGEFLHVSFPGVTKVTCYRCGTKEEIRHGP